MTYDDTDLDTPLVDVEVHEGIALVTSRTLSGTQQLTANIDTLLPAVLDAADITAGDIASILLTTGPDTLTARQINTMANAVGHMIGLKGCIPPCVRPADEPETEVITLGEFLGLDTDDVLGVKAPDQPGPTS